MGIAPADYGDWLLDPELSRLRAEWVKAFQEWDRISDQSPEVMLNDEQRVGLRRYYHAEAAYFARFKSAHRRLPIGRRRTIPAVSPRTDLFGVAVSV